MKRFERGLVVGKFSPLHLGHEHLIRRAAEECGEVVILSYCKPEFTGCEASKRERWLKARFPTARVLVVTDEWLAKQPALARSWPAMPSNDADPEEHRDFCGDLCAMELGLRVDAVYSSEDYGRPFAQSLTQRYRSAGLSSHSVQAVNVDQARERFPISGTLLRRDRQALKRWVAPEVYATFVRRVCFLGGESSGKTTLARSMAERLRTCWAPEYGRELWELRNGKLEYDDLLHIARTQAHREDELATSANDILFCDTSPLTTLFYCLDLFGHAEPELEQWSYRAYDLTVLCASDFPFEQDGTRRDQSFRERQHAWYQREFDKRGVRYVESRGSVAARMEALLPVLPRV